MDYTLNQRAAEIWADYLRNNHSTSMEDWVSIAKFEDALVAELDKVTTDIRLYINAVLNDEILLAAAIASNLQCGMPLKSEMLIKKNPPAIEYKFGNSKKFTIERDFRAIASTSN